MNWPLSACLDDGETRRVVPPMGCCACRRCCCSWRGVLAGFAGEANAAEDDREPREVAMTLRGASSRTSNDAKLTRRAIIM